MVVPRCRGWLVAGERADGVGDELRVVDHRGMPDTWEDGDGGVRDCPLEAAGAESPGEHEIVLGVGDEDRAGNALKRGERVVVPRSRNEGLTSIAIVSCYCLEEMGG